MTIVKEAMPSRDGNAVRYYMEMRAQLRAAQGRLSEAEGFLYTDLGRAIEEFKQLPWHDRFEFLQALPAKLRLEFLDNLD